MAIEAQQAWLAARNASSRYEGVATLNPATTFLTLR